jgi:probable rRNA maturation factor
LLASSYTPVEKDAGETPAVRQADMTVEIEIEADAWLDALPDAADLVRAAAEAAVAEADGRADAEVSFLLTDDAEQRGLNGRFRGKDKSTNVLSFPAPAFAAPHLGDVSLAFETCAKEAEEQEKPLEDHLSHLVAHGVLHLLGYDHESDVEAEAMEALERKVMARLGVPDPYLARGGDGDLRRL